MKSQVIEGRVITIVMGMDKETEDQDPELNHASNMAHINAMHSFYMPRGKLLNENFFSQKNPIFDQIFYPIVLLKKSFRLKIHLNTPQKNKSIPKIL